MKTSEKGFTLLEMSIAVVIIALIAVGVFSGRHLVASAKVSRHVSQIREIEGAYNSFILQYNAIPGDMPTATNYFGSSVKNGNGDDLVSYLDRESFNAYRMLYLADIYKQTSITPDPNYTYFTIGGTHSPACKSYNKCMFTIANAGFTYFGTPVANPRPKINAIIMEGQRKTGSTDRTGFNRGVLDPQDAQAIDTKYDDGSAIGGKIRAYKLSSRCGVNEDQYVDCDGVYPKPSMNQSNDPRKINLYWLLDQ